MSKENFKEKLKNGSCWGCTDQPGAAPHTCPFKVEIDYSNEKCNCCKECHRICDNEWREK